MIVWAGSFPRSGSTLWRIAWHTFTGLPTYSYANDPMLRNVGAVGQKVLPKSYRRMWTLENKPRIYMIKSHLHPSAVDPKDISRKLFIVRDVRDTVVSLARYTTWRKKRSFPNELQRIVDNTQWLNFYNAWTQATDTVVKYEELRLDPRGTVERIVKELGIRVTVRAGGAMPRFAALHKANQNFFRQGGTGNWRKVLSVAQEAQLWKQFGWKMEELGYERGQR